MPFHPRAIFEYRKSFKFIKFVLLNILIRITSYFGDGYIFTSKLSKKTIINKLKKNTRNIIIPHGNDDYYFLKKKIRNKNTKLKIISVSQIDIYKNYINLLKAISILVQRNFEIQLTIIGPIIDKQHYNSVLYLSKKINKIKKGTIIIKGQKNKSQIKKEFKKNDIMIYTSICEAWGMAIQEALTSKLPVMCSNQLGHEKYFKKNIFFFDAFDENDIAEKIIKFTQNNINLRKSSKNSLDANSWDVVAKKTFRFMENYKKYNLKYKFLDTKNISANIKNIMNINNYFIFNFYSVFSFFFIFFFNGDKELSTFYSILFGINNLIYFSFSANMRNLIISNNKLEIIQNVVKFRILISFAILLINFFIIRIFFDNKFYEILFYLSFLISLPWIKEIILCKYLKDKNLISRLFSIEFFIYLLLVLFYFQLNLYFCHLILLIFILNISLILFFLFKNLDHNVKNHFHKNSISLNPFFFSSFSIAITVLILRILINNKLGPLEASEVILLLSLSSFPATLFTNTFGINFIKDNQKIPFIFKIILSIYLVFFFQIFFKFLEPKLSLIIFYSSISAFMLFIFSYVRLVFFSYKDTIYNILRNDIYISFLNVITMAVFLELKFNLNLFMMVSSAISFIIVLYFTSNFLDKNIKI